MESLISDNRCYFIFGTNAELQPYKECLANKPNVKFIDYPHIWDSLAHVLFCKRVIAIDSCIKSLSAMRRIDTTVLLGDYQDDFRDHCFIDPYVHEGIMQTIKFKVLNRSHLQQLKISP